MPYPRNTRAISATFARYSGVSAFAFAGFDQGGQRLFQRLFNGRPEMFSVGQFFVSLKYAGGPHQVIERDGPGKFELPGEPAEFEYARVQNPTRTALELNVAALENGASGHAFASGMSAIACLMTLLKSGDHAVCSRNVYGGTYRYFTHLLEPYKVSFSWVDTTDLAAVEAAITPRTRLVFLETPTNPVMDICDIAAIAAIAHRRGVLDALRLRRQNDHLPLS